MPRPQNFAVAIRLQHKTKTKTRGCYQHNLRLGKIPAYVDQDRINLNSILMQPPTPAECLTIAEEMRSRSDKKRKLRSDAAITTEMLITFGRGVQPFVNELSIKDQNALYGDITEAVRLRLGAVLLGTVAHRDETAPHCHVTFSSFSEFGTPLSKVCSPSVLSEIQDIANEVAKKHIPEIERGVSRKDRIARGDDRSKIVNRSVKQLHEDLPREIEAAEQELTMTLAKIAESTEKLASTEARLRDAEQKLKTAEVSGQRLDSLKKRVEHYEGRQVRSEASIVVLEEQRQTLEMQIAGLHSRQTELADRERAVKQREETVEARRQETERRSKDLNAREAALDQHQATLDGQDEAIGRRMNEAKDLAESNKEASAGLADRERTVEAAERVVASREMKADDREKTLDDREATVREREAATQTHEASLNSRESDVQDREARVTSRERRVVRATQSAEAKEIAVMDAQSKINERSAALDEREAKVSRLERLARAALEALSGVIGAVADRLGLVGPLKLPQVIEAAESHLSALDAERGNDSAAPGR